MRGNNEAIEERWDSLNIGGDYFLREGTTFFETKGEMI